MATDEKLGNPDVTVEKQPLQEGSVEVAKREQGRERQQESATETKQREAALREEESRRKEVAESPSTAPAQMTQTPVQKDQITKDIEDILSSGLGPVFIGMSTENKQAFKLAGEETARKIKVMIDSGKLKVKTVLDLIRSWLRMVPGVNKFFLDQEAKIKTDKLVDYFESIKKNQNSL